MDLHPKLAGPQNRLQAVLGGICIVTAILRVFFRYLSNVQITQTEEFKYFKFARIFYMLKRKRRKLQ